ncbi:MAG: hypothetical protein FWE58_06690 [Methanobrevibacter sp.]|nr:hypothetical protein [Methanobrevibacter sp.]
MNNAKMTVYSGDNFLFNLMGVKDSLTYKPEYLYSEPNEEEVEIVIFETSTGIDFVKIRTENHLLGVHSEKAWVNYTYPEFEMIKQSLIQLKIDDMIIPCDLLHYLNKETNEEKEIYFDISDFFGKQ